MKYPDCLDIVIALIGRAPKGGTHIDVNRRASLIIQLSNPQDIEGIDDSFCPLFGYRTGTLASTHIPVIVGLEHLGPCKDDLKAFGASLATVSSAPMFHILGVTPEAISLEAATGTAQFVPTVEVQVTDLVRCWDQLNGSSRKQQVDLVSLGNPHFSLAEIRKLSKLCDGRKKNDDIAVMAACERATHGLAVQSGLVQELETLGVHFITDTCWCMITDPVIPESTKTIMTNSAKYAHYRPGITGRDFCFGNLALCIETACLGGCGEIKPR
ncbi:Fc.00g073390.m01.CDS01 [Cosmosporella sp. VM-42]